MTPTTKLDRRYSDQAAAPMSWQDAQARVAGAEVAWLVTVREDGRPHTTPVVPVWHEGRAYFHTGQTEQKFVNLRTNPQVLVLAGDTRWDAGVDVVVEGVARRVTEPAVLQAVADLIARRWDGRWQVAVRDGAFVNPEMAGVGSVVFEVVPTKAYGHAKGDPFGQTTFRF
ncbi:MAG TPA: pyridoxamine 5'-phosphate oxidase family protein [Pseudonocardiaceae bacterium]|jgi:general stress protein 26|nr:pyridoxamine 5'-phosphate oxidase family protein [Pseudonocardiaceae bacterium]